MAQACWFRQAQVRAAPNGAKAKADQAARRLREPRLRSSRKRSWDTEATEKASEATESTGRAERSRVEQGIPKFLAHAAQSFFSVNSVASLAFSVCPVSDYLVRWGGALGLLA